MLVGSGVEMTAPLMRCWGRGRNGASFAREMKLSPALSAVLLPQRLMSCVGRVLERVALGAPSTLVWERSLLEPRCPPRGSRFWCRWGCCSPPVGSGGDLLPMGWACTSFTTSLLVKASSCAVWAVFREGHSNKSWSVTPEIGVVG